MVQQSIVQQFNSLLFNSSTVHWFCCSIVCSSVVLSSIVLMFHCSIVKKYLANWGGNQNCILGKEKRGFSERNNMAFISIWQVGNEAQSQKSGNLGTMFQVDFRAKLGKFIWKIRKIGKVHQEHQESSLGRLGKFIRKIRKEIPPLGKLFRNIREVGGET